MSGTDTAIAELTDPVGRRPPCRGPPRLPYLAVADARDAIAWYVDTFGADGGRGTVSRWTTAVSGTPSWRSAAGCSTWPTSTPRSV